MSVITVGQGHDKGRGRGTKHRLIHAGSVAFHDLLYPGPIAFNQVQTVEDIGDHHVPGLGGPTLNVLECQSLDQPAQGDKFHAVIVDVDDDTAGIIIVPMDNGVQQRLSQRGLRVVQIVDPPQPLKCGVQAVIQLQKFIGVIHLLQNGTGELLARLELVFPRPLVDGAADDMAALV